VIHPARQQVLGQDNKNQEHIDQEDAACETGIRQDFSVSGVSTAFFRYPSYHRASDVLPVKAKLRQAAVATEIVHDPAWVSAS